MYEVPAHSKTPVLILNHFFGSFLRFLISVPPALQTLVVANNLPLRTFGDAGAARWAGRWGRRAAKVL